jgi:hypothetical protein
MIEFSRRFPEQPGGFGCAVPALGVGRWALGHHVRR